MHFTVIDSWSKVLVWVLIQQAMLAKHVLIWQSSFPSRASGLDKRAPPSMAYWCARFRCKTCGRAHGANLSSTAASSVAVGEGEQSGNRHISNWGRMAMIAKCISKVLIWPSLGRLCSGRVVWCRPPGDSAVVFFLETAIPWWTLKLPDRENFEWEIIQGCRTPGRAFCALINATGYRAPDNLK